MLGYKDYNFDAIVGSNNSLLLDFIPNGGINVSIDIMVDKPSETEGGIKLGTISISASASRLLKTYKTALSGLNKIKGKHPLYLVYKSDSDKEIGELLYLRFSR